MWTLRVQTDLIIFWGSIIWNYQNTIAHLTNLNQFGFELNSNNQFILIKIWDCCSPLTVFIVINHLKLIPFNFHLSIFLFTLIAFVFLKIFQKSRIYQWSRSVQGSKHSCCKAEKRNGTCFNYITCYHCCWWSAQLS